jgi:hypothetical protein
MYVFDRGTRETFFGLRQNIVDAILRARFGRDEAPRHIARHAAPVARCATIARACAICACVDRDRFSSRTEERAQTSC